MKTFGNGEGEGSVASSAHATLKTTLKGHGIDEEAVAVPMFPQRYFSR